VGFRAGYHVTGPLLTARELAEALGVSAETVLRWTRRGELPAVRLPGGAVRFREHELEAWLAERATPRRGVRTTAPSAALPERVRSAARTTVEGEED
jgi:excisionase family DNA binding protein